MAVRVSLPDSPAPEPWNARAVRNACGGRLRIGRLQCFWRRRPRPSRLILCLLGSALLVGFARAGDSAVLPGGGSVKTGAGLILPSSGQLTVVQSSALLGIDWQSFNIGAHASVVFEQPGASAVALNRVVGNGASQIYGSLSANGQVFLVNPNGVLFAPGARVDVGGLVASTLDLSQQDFAAGRFSFAGNGGALVNQGRITAAPGGYVGLFGANVSNQGVIGVRTGSVLLASGQAVTVDIDNAGLIAATVTGGAHKAVVANSGDISAQGGVVRLDAQAAQGIAESLINNSGVIRANSIENRNGEIYLTGATQISSSGTLDVSGQGSASGGAITVRADMGSGTATVAGQMLAQGGPLGGDGGSIETSGARVLVGGQALVSTSAAKGRTGQWLIDPSDYIVAPSGGDITGSQLGSNLNSTNVTILSSQGTVNTAGNGDIFVNDPVSWSSGNTLTLSALRNVNVNAGLGSSGGGSVVLRSDNTGTGTGTVSFGGSAQIILNGTGARTVDIYYNPSSYANPTAYSAYVSGASAVNAWMLVNSVGQASGGTTGLQALSTNLSGQYALGRDIDASATSGWNSGAGFTPISNFTGQLNGQGHAITGLTIDLPSASYVGLFGTLGSGAAISNMSLVGASITGYEYVGTLAGQAGSGSVITSVSAGGTLISGPNEYSYYTGGLVGYNSGTISYASAAVALGSGSASYLYDAGGLVGANSGTISNSSATGAVSAQYGSALGGLVGNSSSGVISNSFATGTVSSVNGYELGGLVGNNAYTTISNSYATGNVNGGAGSNYIGGLIGYSYESTAASITNSYSTGNLTGASSAYMGGLIGYNNGAVTGVSNSHFDIDRVTINGSTAGVTTGGLYDNEFQDWLSHGFGLNIANYTSSLPFNAGTGAYQIGSLQGLKDLLGFADQVSYKFALTANLDLTTLPGYSIPSFSAQLLNGAGYTLSNIAITQTNAASTGFIGTLAGGSTLENLNLSNVNVSGVGFVGGLVGNNVGGTISNASAGGAVAGSGDYVGGLVGYSTGPVSGSSFSGTVSSTASYVGGLVGYSNAAITSSTSSAAVSTTAGYYEGGLVGYTAGSGVISASSASGSVTNGSAYGGAGGLVGHSNAAISASFATGNVSASTGNYLGGLVGENYGAINSSYAAGNVTGGTTGNYIGGLVGYNGYTIGNSYSTGNVSGRAGGDVAGLVGYNAQPVTSITNSYFDIDRVSVNGASGGVSMGGLYDNEFQDWVSHGLTLNIANYTSSLPFDAGSGSYLISTPQGLKDLLGFATQPAYSFRLTANIDLSTLPGYYIPYFSGAQLDGGGFTLTNLNASQPANTANGDGLGLVGTLASASTLKNLVLSNVTLSGGSYVGGLVGNSAGTIDNVNVSGSVSGATASGDYVGGVIGYVAAGSISYANSSAAVSGQYGVGGLAGSTGSSISIANSTSSGPVSGASSYIGGLVGYSLASISASNASGAVTVTSGANDVGGLVGFSQGAISNSYATGTVTASNGAASSVGGLVGSNNGSISASYATGAVNSDGGTYVGGLVGSNGYTIGNSYSTGNVSGASYVGGLVGNDASTNGISNSHYNIDQVSINGASGWVTVGGLYQAQFQDWLNGGFVLSAITSGLYAGVLPFNSGTGVYQISTLQGLKDLLGFAGQPYKFALTANLDMSSLPGYDIPMFSATQFDGGGHTLSNFSGSQTNNYVGFIGKLGSGSTVQNLNLANVSVSGGSFVGGLVGYNGGGTISSVTVSGAVSGTGSDVGGLVGQAVGGSISNSRTSGTLSAATGSSSVGGLVGDNSGTIANSSSTSTVSGGTSLVGGLVGANEYGGAITGSFASGSVAANSTLYGYSEFVGGLAGYNVGSIGTSYASGAVSATGYFAYYIGGLVGWNYGTISNAYATGSVTAAASSGYSSDVGGLVGYNAGTVATTYASGFVTGAASGGLIGGNGGTSTASYWDVTSSGQTTSAGSEVGLTTAQAMLQGSYAGWNFSSNWWMASGSTRPFLQAEWSASISNSHQLQLMAMDPAASYTLANNINLGQDLASVNGLYPGMWGAGGFVPVGNSSTNFTGALDGQSHYVTGLAINQGSLSNVPTGLFGIVGSTGTVGNLGLNAATVIGDTLNTGMLAGINSGTISNSYAAGSVQGQAHVGGLVGSNTGSITNAYATGSVQGGVGNVSGTAVTTVGGLVGINSGTVTDTYAAGTVPSTANVVSGSGLVGSNSGTVSSSYWNTDTTPAGSVGSGLSTASLEQQASYSGWNFASVWTLYNGNTQAFLTSFMSPLTVTANSVSMVYDRQVYAGPLTASYSNPAALGNLQGSLVLASSEGGNVNANTYSITPSGLWSNNQQGYAISFVPGTLTISPAPLSISGITVSNKVYDGTTAATITGNAPVLSGVIAGDTVSLSGSLSVGGFVSKNAGLNVPVVISGVSLTGPSASNYSFTGTATTTANITPEPLTITAATDTKTYNGSVASGATPTLTSGTVFAGDTLSGLSQAFQSKNALGTNGSTLQVTSYTLSDGNSGGNYAVTTATSAGTINPAILSVTGSQVYTGSTYFSGVNLSVTGVAGDTFLVAGHGTLASAGVQSNQNLAGVSALALTPVGGASLSNYQTLTSANTSVSVTPATLTVTGTQVYNGGTTFAGSNLVVTGVGGETFTASGGGTLSSKDVQSNVALGSVAGLSLNPVNGDSLGNYAALTTANTTVSVTPATLTLVSGAAANKTYDGTTQAAISGGTFSGIVAGDIGNVYLTGYGRFASKNVGNGIAVTVGAGSLGGSAAMDYTLVSSSLLSANITPASLAVTGSEVYNGSTAFAGSSLSVAGVNGETFSASGSGTLSSRNVQTNAPLGSVAGLTLNPVAGSLLSNYNPLTTANTSVSVTPAPLLVAGTQVYNGSTSVPAANLSATGVNGETFTVSGSGTLASKNVQTNQNLASLGTLVLTPVNGDLLGNYQAFSTASTQVSVTPQTLTLTGGTAQNKVYDGTYQATLTGGTFSGLIPGDSVTLSGYGTFANKNVGNNIAVSVGSGSLSGPEAQDYALQPSSALSANITPAALTVTGSQVYNGTTTFLSTNLTIAGVGGETFGALGTATLASKNVQTSQALASVASLSLYGVNGSLLSNYLPLGVGNTSVSVMPATLLASGSQVYNGGLSFAAGNLVVSGVNGESFSASGSGTLSVKDVQSSAQLASVSGITLTPVNGDSLGNYQALAPANTSIFVTPAPLTLTGGTAQNKVYDGTTQAVVSGGSFSGLVPGDSVTLTGYGAFATRNVGNAIPVTVNAGSLTGPSAMDYMLQTANFLAANITPATLTATGSQLYNGSTNFPGGGLTVAGVNGEVFNATGNATLANKNVQANQALASVSGLTLNPVNGDLLSNYLPLSVANTSVSVTPAPLVVTGTQVYNGTTVFAAANLSVAGVNGETFSPSGVGTLSVKDVQTNQPLAGVAGLSLTPVNGDLLSNYQVFSTADTQVTVTPKTVTISNVTALNKVYDGTSTAYLSGGTYVGLIPGDSVSVTGTGSFASKNVGTGIAVTVGSSSLAGPSAPDYLPVLLGSLNANITPATLSVTGTQVYNGTAAFTPANLVVSGVNGETFAASGAAPLASKNVQTSQGLASVSGLALNPVNGDLLSNYFPLTTANTSVSVTPATLTATGTRVYNATTVFAAADLSVAGVNGETFAPSGAGTLSVKDVQTNAALGSVAGLTLSPVNGDSLSNYFPFTVANTSVTVTPAPLTLTGGSALSKVYDGTTVASLSGGVMTGVFAGDTVGLTGLGSFASKNVGNAIPVLLGGNSLSGPSAPDYVLVAASPLSANITPATLSVTGSELYNGTTNFSGSNLVVAGVNGETFAASGSASLGNKNVQTSQPLASLGGLTLTPVNGDLLSNYFPLSTGNTLVSVTPAPLVVTGTQVYNAQTAFAAANLNVAGVNGETFSATGSGTLAVKDVQTNAALGSVAGLTLSPVNGDLLSNYLSLSTGNTSVSVTPALLTLNGGTVFGKVYDGTAVATLGGGSLSGVYSGDTVALTGIGTFSSKNVGANIPVSLSANSLAGPQAADYTLQAANALSASITPATLVASGTELYNGTTGFGGANLVIQGVNGETFTATGSGTLSNKNVQANQPLASVAGLSLSPVGADLLSNYLPLAAANTNVSVTPAPLSVAGTQVYNGGTLFANANLSAAGVNGEIFTLSGNGILSSKNVQTNAVLATVAGLSLTPVNGDLLSNYLPLSVGNTSVSVTPLMLSGSIAPGSSVYGAPLAPGALTLGGVLAGDQVFAAASVNTAGHTSLSGNLQAGNYTGIEIVGPLSGADAGNYSATVVTGNYMVSPKTLTVSGQSALNKVYDGTVNASLGGGVLGGVIAGDAVSLVQTGLFASKNAGAAVPVVATDGLTGASAANYVLQQPGGLTATITPAPLTLTANNASKDYGDPNPAFTSQLSGFVAGETAATAGVTGSALYTTAATALSGVGLYGVVPAAGTLQAANYFVQTLLPGQLTVLPRPLSIDANNVVRFAGDANPLPFLYSTNVGGLVNGDSLASVSINVPAGNSLSLGGDVFALTPSNALFGSGSAGNYAISYDPGLLIVLPKPTINSVQAGNASNAFFVVVNPQSLQQAQAEIARQTAVLGADLFGDAESGTPDAAGGSFGAWLRTPVSALLGTLDAALDASLNADSSPGITVKRLSQQPLISLPASSGSTPPPGK